MAVTPFADDSPLAKLPDAIEVHDRLQRLRREVSLLQRLQRLSLAREREMSHAVQAEAEKHG